MNKLNVVFLSGAGRVGKTSVAKRIEDIAKEIEYSVADRIPVSIVQSTTRASYAAMGIKDESEALSPGFAFPVWEALQNRIFSDYCDNLVLSVKKSAQNKDKVLIVDRTPWDYTSYFLQQAPLISMVDVEERLNKCQDTVESILRDFNSEDYSVSASIWSFCYPVFWTAEDTDTWRRHAPAAKNYIWSLALRQMVDNEIKCLSAPVTHRIFDEYDELSVSERATKVLASIGYALE